MPQPLPAKRLSTGLHAPWADQPGPHGKVLPPSPMVLLLPKALTLNLGIHPAVAARCSPPHPASATSILQAWGTQGPRAGAAYLASLPAQPG